MNKRTLGKMIFLFAFAIYVLEFIDSLMEEPLIGRRTLFSGLFLIILFIEEYFGISRVKNGKVIRKVQINDQMRFSMMIILMYILWLFSPRSEVYDSIAMVIFIALIYFTYRAILRYRAFYQVLMITYFEGAIVLFLNFIKSGYGLYKFNGFSDVFNRTGIVQREAFGFYHVNGCGNFTYIILAISLFLLFTYHCHILLKLIIAFLDFVILNVLLYTNSRTSILALLMLVAVMVYFLVLDSSIRNRIIKALIQFVIVVSAVMAFIVFVRLETIYNLASSSNRIGNFTINLPLLNSPLRIMFGLGSISPGRYGEGTLGLNTYYVDNYYLYVLLDFGIVGLALIGFILIKIGVHLYKNMNLVQNKRLAELSFALFIGQLVLGLGETCVIYSLFLSSYMAMVISFLMYDSKNVDNAIERTVL